jgi:hypothetical protein
MKIYTDDPKVHYITTTISAERTRDEISEVLRQYETDDIHWHWKPEVNDCYVQFVIEEVIDGISARVGAKVVMPTIWDKAVRNSPKPERRIEQVNLKVSMRAMFWYIKSHMENAYAMQSSRIAAFLPDMVTQNGRRYFDTLTKNLHQFQALEYDQVPERQIEVKVIPPKPRNVTHETEEVFL